MYDLTQALAGGRKEQEREVLGNVTSLKRHFSQANTDIDNSCLVVILIIFGEWKSFLKGDAVNC